MIKTLAEAQEYLFSFIPPGNEYRFPGDTGLKRTRELLALLGSPQNKLKVIHIAGTSGKGSTVFYISSLLVGQGFKTGLHSSPHLLDIRERFQINNQLPAEKLFCQYLNEVIPIVEKMTTSGNRPTYFEISVALAYYIFWKEKVDYAVIETGLGGLLDGTNVVDSPDKLAVITRIGHDHIDILGKTLDKIAAQKAGIIHEHNPVVTIWQKTSARKVIERTAIQNKSQLMFVTKGQNYKNVHLNETGVGYDFSFLHYELKNIQLKTPALYQVENSSLALAVIVYLSKRDGFQLNSNTILESFQSGRLIGRMDIRTVKNKTVVLDGAHNPQKMSAFIKSLVRKFPQQKFHFLVAIKKGKDYPDMLKYILPLASDITVTTFFHDKQGFKVSSQGSNKIVEHLHQKNFQRTSKEDDPCLALHRVLAKTKEMIVVTGSLYLVSEIYQCFREEFKLSQ